MSPAEDGPGAASLPSSPISCSLPWESLRETLKPPRGCSRLSSKELLEHALKFHAEHKVVVAGRYLTALEARGPLPPVDAATARKLDSLRLRCRRVCELRASLEAEDGWEVQRDTNGIRCLYQAHESGFVRMRLEAEVDAPMFDLLALLREVHLWPSWMPSLAGLGVTDARELGESSILNMCFRTLIHTPWPIRDRSCCFAVDGVDCMDSQDAPQQVVILLDSRYAQGNCQDPIGSMQLPGQGSAVDLCLLDSGVIITPAEVAGTEYTFMQVICVVDPKMVVPRWLVNLAVRNLCFLVMVQIRRAVAVTRKQAHLDITTDPGNPFYAFIRRRLGESLPEQLRLAPPVAAELPGASSGGGEGVGSGAPGFRGVLLGVCKVCDAICGPCFGRTAARTHALGSRPPGGAAVGEASGPAAKVARHAALVDAAPAGAKIGQMAHWAVSLKVILAVIGSYIGLTVLASQAALVFA